jgi:hypothetical protein
MASADVGVSRIAANVAFFGIGCAAVFVAARRPSRPPGALVGVLLVMALAATLVGAGLDEVHRWIGAGPVRVNVSMLIAPWLLVAVGRLAERGRVWEAVALASAVQLLHVAQPDAAQAAAFAVGVVVMLGPVAAASRVSALVGVVVSSLLAVAAFMRPDSLDPVPDVEGIVGVVGGAFPGGTVLAVAALALLVMPLARACVAARAAGPHVSLPQLMALTAYLVAVLVMPVFLHVPVIVMGYGVSTVLAYASILVAARTVAQAAVWKQ